MFKQVRTSKIWVLQVAVVASLFWSPAANAAGTTSDTDIDNMATITYSVGGSSQTPIESSPTGNSTPGLGVGTATTFKVDNMIDFSVTEADTAYTPVVPGATFQALGFIVQNDGNSTQDFSFTAAEVTTGGPDGHSGTDDFDGTAVGIFVESGATAGYQQSEDTATYVDELGEDLSATVWVVRNIGAGEADADTSGVILIAQVAQGGTANSLGTDITTDDSLNPDTPGTVEIIFADAAGDDAGDLANDGKHSDTDGFIVRTVTLAITKQSQVISDPVNLATNPKAIPGATIEYTITVDNTAGSGTATNVTVADDLSVEVGAGTIAFDINGYAALEGLQVTAPNLYSGAATSLTNAAADDEGTWDAGSNTLTVSGIEVAPGEVATVTYRVTIQ